MFENSYLNLINKILALKSFGKDRKSTACLEKAIAKKRIGEEISKRSEEDNKRISKYSWELDTIQGKRNDELMVLSLLNRRSRKHIIVLIERTSQAVLNAVKYLIEVQKIRFDSITIYNGSENYKLDQLKGIKIYHCQPYNFWQKGSIESVHRIFRRFVLKGVSLNKLTMRDIFAILKRINKFSRYNKEFGKLMLPNDFEKIGQVSSN